MSILLETGTEVLATEDGLTLVVEREQCLWPTLEEVKTELGVITPDDDAFIQRQINATINSIEKYLGRKVPLQTDTEVFRISECDKQIGHSYRLQLGRWPLLEVMSCTDNQNGALSFSIDEDGMLCGNFGYQHIVTVNYHGGLSCSSLDFDAIVDVFWQMVEYRYTQKNAVGGGAAAGTVKKESIPGVMSVEYFSGTEGSTSTSSNPSDPKAYGYILDQYRAYFV